MEPRDLKDNYASPSPPPPPPMSQAELPAPILAQSPPLSAYPPEHWTFTSPPMSQAELPPQSPPLPAHSPPSWSSASQPMSQAEPPYYYQPMVMPPPLHYQPAPWVPPPGQYSMDSGIYGPGVPPPGQHNADSGIYGPGVPAYEYNYPGYSRSWATRLCDCSSDMRNCLVTAFCPCVTFGQISEIVNEGQTSCWEGCLLYGLVSVFFGVSTGGIFTGVLGGFYRNKLREKYKLRGTVFSDFLVHALCEPCALCQEYRELGRFGFEVPLGWKFNMEMQSTATAVYQVAPAIELGMMR